MPLPDIGFIRDKADALVDTIKETPVIKCILKTDWTNWLNRRLYAFNYY
jgi:hypothetical protein